MSVSNVILLTESPLSKRDHDRFGVEILSKRFQVHILDCTAWLNPEFWKKYSNLAYRCPGYLSVGDMNEFLAHVGKRDAIVIDYLGDGVLRQRIRGEIKRRNIRRVIVQHGLLPTPPGSITGKLSRGDIAGILPRIARRTRRLIDQFFDPIVHADIALLSGLAGAKEKDVASVPIKIWAHSFDYDAFLERRGHGAAPYSVYALFLDEDMIHHTDYEHAGISPPATERPYFLAMNAFFREFEKHVGMPVRIAAHPRSRYDLRPDLWEGRPAILGQTAELVRDASFILCHQSTALSFAVLWTKPTIFLTSNELSRSFLGPRIFLGSSLLGAPVVNIDHARDALPDVETLLNVDASAYSRYVENYIKRPGTPELPVWEVFSDYVLNHLA